MPTVKVTTKASHPPKQIKTPRVTIRTLSRPSRTWTLPYAPQEVNHTNLGLTYAQTPRPRNKPILDWTEKPLREISMDVTVADRSHGGNPGATSVERVLNDIVQIARLDQRIRISYGPMAEKIDWKITSMSVKSTQRDASNQHIALAVVSFTFTEATTVLTPIVPGMERISYIYVPVTGPGKPGGKSTPSKRSINNGQGDAPIPEEAS